MVGPRELASTLVTSVKTIFDSDWVLIINDKCYAYGLGCSSSRIYIWIVIVSGAPRVCRPTLLPPKEMGLNNHPHFFRPHNIGGDQMVTRGTTPNVADWQSHNLAATIHSLAVSTTCRVCSSSRESAVVVHFSSVHFQ